MNSCLSLPSETKTVELRVLVNSRHLFRGIDMSGQEGWGDNLQKPGGIPEFVIKAAHACWRCSWDALGRRLQVIWCARGSSGALQ